MSVGALGKLVRLRRYEERTARLALAEAAAAAMAAEGALGQAPVLPPAGRGLAIEAFLAQRASSHMAWAAWGVRLGRAEEARGRQEAAGSAWAKAASDLKAVERLMERRAQRAEVELARAAQRDLDEVAIRQWRRARRAVPNRPQ